MAKQSVIWTVVPRGQRKGRWCVSLIVSPRLTPQSAAEQQLGHAAWKEWHDWPATLAEQRFELLVGGTSVSLKPFAAAPELKPDSALWQQLFFAELQVAEFKALDISQVNLRSFPIRNVLGLLRRHYTAMSATAGGADHPLLLPWRIADPQLKGFLGELGTRTITQNFGHRSIERLFPGFGRFHEGKDGKRPHEARVNRAVFNAKSCIKAPARLPGQGGRSTVFPLRALPPDWEDPAAIRSGAIAVDPLDRDARATLMDQFNGPAEYALWQSDRFYRRTVPTDAQLAKRRPDFAGMSPALVAPEFDFHQRIASYGDHPNLLRRLGLVIDCVLDDNAALDALFAALGPGVFADGQMRLRLSAGAPHDPSGDLFPRSAFQIRKDRFCLRARTSDHEAGLLRLADANDRYGDEKRGLFDLYQIDPDGGALKTVGTLLSAQNLVGKSLELGADGGVTYTTGDRQPLAALRAGGIGVSRHGRAGQVGMHAATAGLNDAALRAGGAAAASVLLFAEDLLRGYRVDVMDQGRWRSLCEREGDYTALAQGELPEQPIALPPDEGHVKGASTTRQADASADHYLHETLFRWSGWSLAAPRPGRTLRDRKLPGTQLQVEEVVDQPDPSEVAPRGNGLSVRMSAKKGSLPRLRFGARYRLRARLVDLAGNSLLLDEPAETEQASDWLRYGRFEPVDPPTLLLRQRLSEGESLERLVLRSNHDRSTADYQADIEGELAVYYANPDFAYAPIAQRHVVPPKSAQLQCEQHGLFDGAIGSTDADRIKQAYALAARESGSLLKAGDPELITPTRLAAVATVDLPPPPPEQADAGSDRLAAGQYLIHREPLVPAPYLPDAASGGIALRGVPGLARWCEGKPLETLAPGLLGYRLDAGARAVFFPERKDELILLLDFDRTASGSPDDPLAKGWPDDRRSLRLELLEQPDELTPPPCGAEHTKPDAPRWSPDEGWLQIFLPKGHIARLRYASFVHDQVVGQLGLPWWQDQPQLRQRLQVEGLAGVNWMLTPWRRLTLVHATQQPVCEPRLAVASVQRGLGEQHATLQARQVWLHGPSTGKFEVLAQWTEWQDDPGRPAPERVPHEAVLSEILLGENHRNVFSLAQAVAAQRHFQPVGGQQQPADVAARPAVPGNRHEFGDTRARFVRYQLRASTRFREYLPPPLFDDRARISRVGPVAEEQHLVVQALAGLADDEDAGAPLSLVNSGTAQSSGGLMVPSSQAPLPPEIVYTLPTFRWERPAPVRSTRHGNGLRVYLERPWFSSGDGELLGVVLAGEGAAFAALTPAQLPLVTQWGLDPMWDSPKPVTTARGTQFPLAVSSENVLLQEGGSAFVVGHRVHFDPTRKLWFADIELNTGSSYMPFVRLALVRYQPFALEAAKVSTVVLAEFAQLLPRRRAELLRSNATVMATVHGPAASRGPTRRLNAGGGFESEWANLSLNMPGGPDGRNRLELVLQSRPSSLDSDLAWSDELQLVSGRVGGDPATRSAPPEALPDDAVLQTPGDQVQRRGGRGQTLRFDRLEPQLQASIGSAVGNAVGNLTPGIVNPGLFDPPVWQGRGALPALKPNREYRLMLREFERYYTDRSVPDRQFPNRRRVVIEERLVYGEVFALPPD